MLKATERTMNYLAVCLMALLTIVDAMIPPSCKVTFYDSVTQCAGEPMDVPTQEIQYNWLDEPCGDDVYNEKLFECCVPATLATLSDDMIDQHHRPLTEDIDLPESTTWVNLACEAGPFVLCGLLPVIEMVFWSTIATLILACCACFGCRCYRRRSKVVEDQSVELKGLREPEMDLTA